MTSNPNSPERPGRAPSSNARLANVAFSAATEEALLRYDEATAEELSELELVPGASAVLAQLRAADAYLSRGALVKREEGVDSTPEIPAEQLYDYGRGQLAPDSLEAVQAHLARTPREQEWVESLQNSPPPATLTWDEVVDEDTEPPTNILRVEEKSSFPGWLAWTPLAAAALILAMAVGGTGRRSVLDGGLPNSPIVRSASADALLFPRGRVIASTPTTRTYASRPLFEVTPVDGASQYGFELRSVSGQNVFSEGEVVWESTSSTYSATAPELDPGKYTWTATATVQGIDRVLGSLSFTVVPARSVDRALFVRAANTQSVMMPTILREDIRRLHASGFLTDARSKARALPPGGERDKYLGISKAR